MARALRPLFLAVLLALTAASAATASTPYDPDNSGLSLTSPADVTLASGACTFDTLTGAISGAGCPSARAAGGDGTGVDGIGVFVIPSGSVFEPDTTEFVMSSLSTVSGSAITYAGANNLVIATLHDLTLASGASVKADGLGGAGGSSHSPGSGFGAGEISIAGNCPDAGGGGSFGGLGGDGGNGVPSGGTYGSDDQSQHLDAGSGGGGAGTGSGCGTTPGGNGGGGLGLLALGTLTVNGTVSANGMPTAPSSVSNQGGPGAGSGGAIFMLAPHLVLASQSVAQAKGGVGISTTTANGSGGGGGGGGRIITVSDQPSGALNPLSTEGGQGGSAPPGIGLGGRTGNGGSVGGLPFVTVSGPGSRQAGSAASFSSSVAAGDATYEWNFGDGASGSGATPSHAYTTPGTYDVSVTATLTDSNQTATAHRSITITAPPSTGGGGGGGSTPVVPPLPAPAPAVDHCIVPKLKGLSLKAARKKLAHAHCKLGKVRKLKLRKGTKKKPNLVIVKQPAPNRTLPAGTKLNLTLGPAKPKRKHH